MLVHKLRRAAASAAPFEKFLAVAHYSSPYVTIYGQVADTFTKLADPAASPSSFGLGVAFSADGTYMAVAHILEPYVTIYKRSGDTFTNLLAASPSGAGRDVAFSADGTHMAVAHDSSPFITVYKRNGDTFTKWANPAALPTGDVHGVAFYPRAFEGPI